MYHDIVTASDKTSGFQNKSAFMYKVDVRKFEEQVKIAQGSDVVFTFDDGGLSLVTEAAPVLEKYGMKGVFFISTKYIDTPGFLTATQVKELELRGHVIGSHSHNHQENMTVLERDELLFEWKESLRILSDILGHPVTIASIPNGYDSIDVINTAYEAGITELHTSKPTEKEEMRNGCKLIGRYVVHDNMSNDYVASIIKSSSIRKKIYRRWQIINIAKLILGKNYNVVKMFLIK